MRFHILLAASIAAFSGVFAASVETWQTVGDGEMAQLRDGPVTTTEEAWQTACVDLDAAKPSHPYTGLGGSLGESSCRVLARLDAARRRAVLEMLFTRAGANLSMLRLHVGSSDYSASIYSYDEVPGDVEMKHFSIDHDRKEIIPMVREALEVRPDMFVFSSPWSPPGWMKTNGGPFGGWMRSEYLEAFCDYYVAYLKAYRDAGIKIRALTIQNEPECGRPGSTTCLWHPEQEARVAGYLLPPRLKAAGLDVGIWLWDHNYDGFRRVLDQLKDPKVLGAIDAVAWHPYCGDAAMLDRVRRVHPTLRFEQTEMGPALDDCGGEPRTAIWWARKVFDAFNHGCSSFCNWCLVLDPQGGPNAAEGLSCAGFLAVDPADGRAEPSPQYRLFRHIGPFVAKGASVLATSFTTEGYYPHAKDLMAVAFRNPDGSDVVVAACAGEKRGARRQFQFRKGGVSHLLSLPCGSVTTFVIK